MSELNSRSAFKRADAERNRAKILAAARTAFGEPQADVSMAEISRRAGVGMATLYRNFPGRRELLEAVLMDEVDTLCEAAKPLEGETPGALLATWLRRFFTVIPSKRLIISELLEHADHNDPMIDNDRARVIAAGRPLLAAAQEAREVRNDLTLEQILDMIIAIAKIPSDRRYLEPILQTTLDGLHPQPLASPRKTAGD